MEKDYREMTYEELRGEEEDSTDRVLRLITEDPLKEAKCLTDYMRSRLTTKLSCNVICTGEIGKGKSYLGIRLLELWYRRWFNENFPKTHICKTLKEVMTLIKGFTRVGEGILIEELSVLAGSRNSLTKENKNWNDFMDIIRKKQVIIVGNLPSLSYLDKHMISLCNVWIDVLGFDLEKKYSVCKPKWFNHPTFFTLHPPYQHLFINEEGDGINLLYFLKMSKELNEYYDKFKNKHVEDNIDAFIKRADEIEKDRKKEKGKASSYYENIDKLVERLGVKGTAELLGKSEMTIYRKLKQKKGLTSN